MPDGRDSAHCQPGPAFPGRYSPRLLPAGSAELGNLDTPLCDSLLAPKSVVINSIDDPALSVPSPGCDPLARIFNLIEVMRAENKESSEKLLAELKADRDYMAKQLHEIWEELNINEQQWLDVETRVKALEDNNTKMELLIAENNKQQENRIRMLQEGLAKPASTTLPNAEDRLMEIEQRLEKQDRARRKLNVIIKGLDATPNTVKEITTNFLHSRFHRNDCLADARVIGSNSNSEAILATLKSWEDKLAILRMKKSVLGNQQIFIEHDNTPTERVIERHLRKVEKVERAKGKEVVRAYGRLRIDGVWLPWNNLQHARPTWTTRSSTVLCVA